MRSGSKLQFLFIRAPIAVVGGTVIGQVAQLVLALLLDLALGNDATGGRWPITAPNIFLICMVGLASGFVAGYIAGRRGKLLGGITAFFPLFLLLTVTVILNVDPTEHMQELYDTRPAVWAWLALVPGIFGGHYGALARQAKLATALRAQA